MLIDLGTEILNLASVRTVKDGTGSSSKQPLIDVVFMDGSARTVYGSFDDICRQIGTMMPAPAGYSVISAHEPDSDETEWYFDIEPVLAFVMDAIQPTPITHEGMPRGNNWALILPDGRCSTSCEVFPHVEAFKLHYNRRAPAEGTS